MHLLHKFHVVLFLHSFSNDSNTLPVINASYYTHILFIHQYDTRDNYYLLAYSTYYNLRKVVEI